MSKIYKMNSELRIWYIIVQNLYVMLLVSADDNDKIFYYIDDVHHCNIKYIQLCLNTRAYTICTRAVSLCNPLIQMSTPCKCIIYVTLLIPRQPIGHIDDELPFR